jgi:WD40 repeat protein
VWTLLVDGGVLYSGAADHTVRAWDTDTGACLREWRGFHSEPVRSLCSCHGGVLAGGDDGLLHNFGLQVDSYRRRCPLTTLQHTYGLLLLLHNFGPQFMGLTAMAFDSPAATAGQRRDFEKAHPTAARMGGGVVVLAVLPNSPARKVQ